MAVQIQYRRGEAAEWTTVNPTLAIGEPGYEIDTGRIKIGDGVTAWNDLIYTAANSLLSGDGPPNDITDGKIGDFYIDTLNDSIYGPKTETGWGVGVDFVVSTINGLLDVDTITDPPSEGEALIWNPTGGDGTGAWVPGSAGAKASGAVGQIQYNDGAPIDPGLASSASLTWDDTAKELSVGGDINLDDGVVGPVTTLQTITPTQDNTISLPNATGTVGLVAGSSGQLVYNNAGAYAGVPSTNVGASGDITLSANGTFSTPPLKLTGTWVSGGDGTTTTPQVLIEPSTATPSTTWSTSGTGLGINAASTFNGNLLDLQVDGASKTRISSVGGIYTPKSALDGGAVAGYFFDSPGNLIGFRCDANNNIGVFTRGGQAYSSYLFGTITRPYFKLGRNFSIAWGENTGDVARFEDEDLFLSRDAADTLAQRRSTNAQTYRLYNTYTDASNYQRTSFTDGADGLVIDQQYATDGGGPGAVRTNLLDLKDNGTSYFSISNRGRIIAGPVNAPAGGDHIFRFGGGQGQGISFSDNTSNASFRFTYYGVTGWGPGAGYGLGGVGAAPDVKLVRDQVGVVAITNGSTGTGYLKTTPVAVSALPAAATVGAGTRGFVSDSTVAASGNFGATVTGGGSNNVPVFSDGTNWLIG